MLGTRQKAGTRQKVLIEFDAQIADIDKIDT